jgi:methylthioribulose-1-phosphate dehydratase
MTNRYSKMLQELSKVKALFASRGWMLATSGNFSVRVHEKPLEFFISVSGRDKSIDRPDDFILVNDRGEPIKSKKNKEKQGLKPSAEVGIHAEIYKRIPAGVILHVHTLSNTYASIHSQEPTQFTLQGLEMIKGLGIWEEENRVQVPIVPNDYHLERLSSAVGKAIRTSTPGVLLRGHGLYAWGKTLHEAKRNVEAFEFLFQFFCLEEKKRS